MDKVERKPGTHGCIDPTSLECPSLLLPDGIVRGVGTPLLPVPTPIRSPTPAQVSFDALDVSSLTLRYQFATNDDHLWRYHRPNNFTRLHLPSINYTTNGGDASKDGHYVQVSEPVRVALGGCGGNK